jgi:hypothetical protein
MTVLLAASFCFGFFRNFHICLKQLNHGIITPGKRGMTYNYAMLKEAFGWTCFAIICFAVCTIRYEINALTFLGCSILGVMSAINCMTFLMNLRDHKLHW